jgi:(R,R)-butanediol dehydrogenase/meso-butanediol dehydrogenase/diacetyl reductase
MKGAYYSGKKTFQIAGSELQAPGPGQVRLKVAYSGICGTDYHIYLGHMDWRIKTPQVIGHEMSGEIAAIGVDVKGFKVGDKVVVRPLAPCFKCPSCSLHLYNICPNLNFLGVDSPGSFQSNWTVPAHTLHHLPDAIDMKLAALIEPVAVASHDIRLAQVAKNDYVVVLGAGPIGLLIAMLSKARGARVLISEINLFRIKFARDLGIAAVNPNEVDLPEYVKDQTDDTGADVVFEVIGTTAGAEMMTKLSRTRGRVVIVGLFPGSTPVDVRTIVWRELNISGARNYEEVDFVTAISTVLSRSLPLESLISDVRPLEKIQSTFAEIEKGANFMKVLFNCSD